MEAGRFLSLISRSLPFQRRSGIPLRRWTLSKRALSKSGRVGYWDSTNPEALTLEKAFAPRWQKKTTSLPRFLLRTFINEAQAQGIFSSIFGGSSDNGASSLVGGAQSTGAEISNLNTTLEDFNDDFDNLSLQLDSLNETCAKTFIIDKFSHDDSFHDKNQKKRKICRDAHDGSYLGKRFERNEFRSKDMRDKKIKGYEQNRGQNRRNYLMNLEVENQRLTSFQRFFDEIYEQQLCFENPENPECQEKAKIKFMGPFYVKDRAKVKLKEICGLDDFL